jgi:septal ring-binding cell division protein DamX
MTPPLASREAEAGVTAGLPVEAIPAAPQSEGYVAQDSADPTPESPSPPPSHQPPAQPGKANLIVVTAIVVIIALVAGAFIYSTILGGNTGEPSVSVVTPAITPEATMIPTPTTVPQTPAPQITVVPTPKPTVMMPEKGVWVKVHYSGNFTGRVGTSGNLKQVNASGDQYYQIPITDGIVEVLLQKEDGSANMLTVEIYQNGRMVTRSTKSTPFGTIEVRETIKRG